MRDFWQVVKVSDQFRPLRTPSDSTPWKRKAVLDPPSRDSHSNVQLQSSPNKGKISITCTYQFVVVLSFYYISFIICKIKTIIIGFTEIMYHRFLVG